MSKIRPNFARIFDILTLIERRISNRQHLGAEPPFGARFQKRPLSLGDAPHDVVVVFAAMRQGACTAILNARAVRALDVGEIPAARLTQAVERAKTEQAVEVLGGHVMTGVKLAGRMVKEPVVLALPSIGTLAALCNHSSASFLPQRPMPATPLPETAPHTDAALAKRNAPCRHRSYRRRRPMPASPLPNVRDSSPGSRLNITTLPVGIHRTLGFQTTHDPFHADQ